MKQDHKIPDSIELRELSQAQTMEEKKTEYLTLHDWEMAFHSQSACNLSGIVFQFARTMQKICNEANRDGQGTEWKNQHPICRLYAEQIAFLSGAGSYRDFDNYNAAYSKVEDECKKLTGMKFIEALQKQEVSNGN